MRRVEGTGTVDVLKVWIRMEYWETELNVRDDSESLSMEMIDMTMSG